jgi:7,8-dihydroneopterin aldolase/epimerase/oxygenase
MTDDFIEIRGLEIDPHIGVPDAERASPQRLLVDLRLQPQRDFSRMADAIGATVDYFALAQRVVTVAAGRPRLLIETLADELATTVLREFALRRVEVTVRKFILPNAEFVAAHCGRERNR